MQERTSLVVDEKAPVVALVAERVNLNRLTRGIIRLVFSLKDRCVARAMRATRLGACRRPLIVIVAVCAVDDASRRITRLKPSHSCIAACTCNRVGGGVAWVDLQPYVPDVVLAQNSRGGGLVPDAMTFEAYFILVKGLGYGSSGDVYTANTLKLSRCCGRTGRGGRCLVRVVTVLARDMACHCVGILAGLMAPIRGGNRMVTGLQKLGVEIFRRYCAAVADEAHRSLLRAAKNAGRLWRGVRPMTVLTSVVPHC
jgi:hypothetical protein